MALLRLAPRHDGRHSPALRAGAVRQAHEPRKNETKRRKTPPPHPPLHNATKRHVPPRSPQHETMAQARGYGLHRRKPTRKLDSQQHGAARRRQRRDHHRAARVRPPATRPITDAPAPPLPRPAATYGCATRLSTRERCAYEYKHACTTCCACTMYMSRYVARDEGIVCNEENLM